MCINARHVVTKYTGRLTAQPNPRPRKKPMKPNDLLTLTQAAEVFADHGIDRRQLARACNRGEIRKYQTRKGRGKKAVGAPIKYRVSRSDVEAWLIQREIPAEHYTIKEAATRCGVGWRLLYDAINSGEVPAYSRDRRFGLASKKYVTLENVEAWRDRKGVRTYRPRD